MSYGLLSALFLSSMVSSSTIGALKRIPDSNSKLSLTREKSKKEDDSHVNSQANGDIVQYRLYIDSTNDILPYKKNAIDFNYGAVAKNKWHDVELPLMSFNYSDFEVENKNHEDLIEALGGTINVKYKYAFNMWDSKWGWRYDQNLSSGVFSEGKEVSLKDAESSITLLPTNLTETVQWEMASTETEQGRIQIKQIWNDSQEVFSISAVMGVSYNWKWGSIYSHASLTKFAYEGLDGSTSLKTGAAGGAIIEQLNFSKTENEFKLDDMFDAARDIYDKKLENGWQNAMAILGAYGASGSSQIAEGTIFSSILILNNLFLMSDLNFVVSTGDMGNASLKLVTNQGSNGIVTDMYYHDIHGISHYLSSAGLPIRNRNVSVILYGLWTLSYVYTTVNSHWGL